MQYTKSPLSFGGIPQPIMVGEKFIIDIDEEKYNDIIIKPELLKLYPEADEDRIQRLVQLEADIIAIYFEAAWVDNKFKHRPYNWLVEKLNEYKRLDNTITETDISVAFKRNLDNQRIKKVTFPDCHVKYIYNAFHYEKVALSEPEPKPVYKPKDGKNPFE